MATRSYILKENDDGTFSARYHHWDGYPDGLGAFLHEHLSSKEKVDWLFDLERSFGSVFSKKSYPGSTMNSQAKDDYKQNKQGGTGFDYPKEFSVQGNVYVHAHPAKDQGGVITRKSWGEVFEGTNKSYAYLFKNSAWYILIHRAENWQDCRLVKISDFLKVRTIVGVIEEGDALPKILEKLKERQKERGVCRFWDVSSPSELKNVFDIWVGMPSVEQDALLEYLKYGYDLDNRVDFFDQLAKSKVSQEELNKTLGESKKIKKKLNSKAVPRKI